MTSVTIRRRDDGHISVECLDTQFADVTSVTSRGYKSVQSMQRSPDRNVNLKSEHFPCKNFKFTFSIFNFNFPRGRDTACRVRKRLIYQKRFGRNFVGDGFPDVPKKVSVISNIRGYSSHQHIEFMVGVECLDTQFAVVTTVTSRGYKSVQSMQRSPDRNVNLKSEHFPCKTFKFTFSIFNFPYVPYKILTGNVI